MRKAKPKKRILLPDPKFNDPYVTRFINNLMYSGKKTVAFRIFYDSLDIVGDKMKNAEKTPLEIWKQALDNVTPHVEVKSRRVSISMKNLILFARKRTGRSMAEKLAAEVMAAYNQEGGAFKKKEDTHRMAEANKAFAHFRF